MGNLKPKDILESKEVLSLVCSHLQKMQLASAAPNYSVNFTRSLKKHCGLSTYTSMCIKKEALDRGLLIRLSRESVKFDSNHPKINLITTESLIRCGSKNYHNGKVKSKKDSSNS